MFRYRSQRIALIVSVLIHILILFIYRPLAKIRIFPDRGETALAKVAEPLVFELVETPDDAIRRRPEKTNLLSDKDAIARDEYQDNDRETGDAYSEGLTPYRVFAGQSEPPGMDQEPSQEAHANRSRSEPQDRPREIDPEKAGDYSDSDQQEGPPAEVEDYLNTKTIPGPLSMQSQFFDDVNYDQRKYSVKDLGGISLSTYAWNYASYIFDMKRKLRSNTYPPAVFTLLGMISGETVLKFKVLPDGTATDIEVIDYRGDRSLMETSLDAVRISSPFRPLPRDFPDEFLELKWTFVYYVYR